MPADVVIYTSLVPDEVLRPHLERQDTVVFRGLVREWQQIERQVERLGFGEGYVVSQRSANGGSTVVSAERATARL